jgi:hypothetical protein
MRSTDLMAGVETGTFDPEKPWEIEERGMMRFRNSLRKHSKKETV